MATKRTMSTTSAHGSSAAPPPAAVAEAIAAFDQNDVEPFDAIFYSVAHIDLGRFLALRMAGTVAAGDEVQAMLKREEITSPMLLEQGAAAAYDAAQAHDQALAVRLQALRDCPRYDGWFTALLLSRTAASLLALGRPEEALPLAARALRFQPLDPPAMVILSQVHDVLGDHAAAARLRAWLYDAGVSPAYLPGPPTKADLDAEPYEADLDRLEPLSDVEMARYLVMFRIDVGLTDTLVAGRRHLAAQLRHAVGGGDAGNWQAARTASAFYRGGSPVWSSAGSWLGLPITMNNEYVATNALIEAIDAGAKARKVSVLPPDLAHRLAGVRAATIRAQVDAGAKVPRHLLTDLIWDVAKAAAKALPDDPLVQAARALEADGDLDFAPKIFSDQPADSATVPHTIGARDHFLRDGVRINYPQKNATTPKGKADDWFPVIEVAAAGRSRCKVCKSGIAAGDVRLVVRSKLFPVDAAYAHAACAPAHKKFGPAWKTAAARSRMVLSGRV